MAPALEIAEQVSPPGEEKGPNQQKELRAFCSIELLVAP
jgi:hypothetical protein